MMSEQVLCSAPPPKTPFHALNLDVINVLLDKIPAPYYNVMIEVKELPTHMLSTLWCRSHSDHRVHLPVWAATHGYVDLLKWCYPKYFSYDLNCVCRGPNEKNCVHFCVMKTIIKRSHGRISPQVAVDALQWLCNVVGIEVCYDYYSYAFETRELLDYMIFNDNRADKSDIRSKADVIVPMVSVRAALKFLETAIYTENVLMNSAYQNRFDIVSALINAGYSWRDSTYRLHGAAYMFGNTEFLRWLGDQDVTRGGHLLSNISEPFLAWLYDSGWRPLLSNMGFASDQDRVSIIRYFESRGHKMDIFLDTITTIIKGYGTKLDVNLLTYLLDHL
jgi:hypothetical protein